MFYRLDKQTLERARRAIGEGTTLRSFALSRSTPQRRAVAKPKAGKPVPSGGADSEWPAGEVYARINSLAIDRHDTIVDPLGCRVDSFTKNPILLWAHGCDARGSLPIGTVPELDMGSDYIDALMRFDVEDEFSANLYRLYNNSILKGTSIGFVARAATVDEIETMGQGPDGQPVQGVFEVLRYTDWDLVELSCVSVPSNPDALAIG